MLIDVVTPFGCSVAVSVVPPVTPGDGAVREERRRSSGQGCAQAHLPDGKFLCWCCRRAEMGLCGPLHFQDLHKPWSCLRCGFMGILVDVANGVMPVLQTCQDVPLQAVAMLETGAPAHVSATLRCLHAASCCLVAQMLRPWVA